MKSAFSLLHRLLAPALLLGLLAVTVHAADDLSLSAPEQDNGYLKLGFDKLANYKFIPPAYDPAADPKAESTGACVR